MSDGPWSSGALEAEDTSLVQLPTEVIHALSRGDLEAAQAFSNTAVAPDVLTPYLVSPEGLDVWRMSSEQVAAAPGKTGWVARLIVDFGAQRTVGWAGFRGPPDPVGVVEIGYAVDPVHRRKGYAEAALVILLEKAEALPEVRTVRASLSTDDLLCRRLVTRYGFVNVGEHKDDESERLAIFERTLPPHMPSLRPRKESDDVGSGSSEPAGEALAGHEQLEIPAHPAAALSLGQRLATFVRNLTGR
ncbi:GNAT family N-acetyltransferase [Arthrobacter sp. H41]|uniref:GNAT family N-acetyltransferase n=1 Tax=Arthrobacter sp. H41 TaxID=1312978 RepID=UPI0009DE4AFD|nr:GNAT family N-acetyltransferase [Arthrobacter sp. H41]